MRPGTRVVVKEPCIWPSRGGCLATVVAPAVDGTYPQPGPGEVLLLLDDDPLDATKGPPGYPITWTCCMAVSGVHASFSLGESS